MAASASTPALPGTKYGDTNLNSRTGAPMLVLRRCQSNDSSGAWPRPFAGSSLTICVGDHSNLRRCARRSPTNGDRASAATYAAAAGSRSARVEVFVPNVAPADNGRVVVGGERLVVHAPVQALEVREIAQQAPAARPEGIEQPHVNVRMRVERGEHAVEAGGVVVIEQEPY